MKITISKNVNLYLDPKHLTAATATSECECAN